LTGFLTTGELKIPKQPELRERELRDLVLKRKKPVVLIVEEAHELHHYTLTGLKRLREMIEVSNNSKLTGG